MYLCWSKIYRIMTPTSSATTRFYRIFAATVIVITIVGAGAWLCSTNRYLDDYNYEKQLAGPDPEDYWESRGEPILTWSDAFSTAIDHYRYINGRLANIVVILLQPLPRAVGALIAAIGLGWWLALMIGLGGWRNRLSVWLIAAAVILMWTAFPWYDSFQSIAYQFNYPLASAWTLAVMWTVRPGAKPVRRCRAAGAIALGVVAGWWHEAFGVTLLGMLATLWYLNSARPELRRLILKIGVGVAVGVCLSIFSGTLIRAKASATLVDYSMLPYMATRLLGQIWVVLVAIVAVGLYCCLRRRKTTDKPRTAQLLHTVAPYLAGGALNLAMMLMIMSSGRALWPAMLCGVMVLLCVISAWSGSQKPTRRGTVTAAVVATVYVLWWIGIVREQCRVTDSLVSLEQSLTTASRDSMSIVWADLPYDQPWWTGGLTSLVTMRDNLATKCLSSYYRLPGLYHAALPADYAQKSVAEWDTIAGRNDLRGRWPQVVGLAPHGRPEYFIDTWSRTSYWRVTVGEPLQSATPLNRLLHSIKCLMGRDDNTVRLKVRSIALPMPDGDSCYLYYHEAMPRTMTGRRIVSIDFEE